MSLRQNILQNKIVIFNKLHSFGVFHIISFDPTVKELSNIKGNKIAEWHVTQSSSQITAISSHKLKTKPSLGPNLLCIYNIKRFKDNIGGGLDFYRTGR